MKIEFRQLEQKEYYRYNFEFILQKSFLMKVGNLVGRINRIRSNKIESV